MGPNGAAVEDPGALQLLTAPMALSSEDPLVVVIVHLRQCRLHPYRLHRDRHRLLGVLQAHQVHRHPHHHHPRHLHPLLTLVVVCQVAVLLVVVLLVVVLLVVVFHQCRGNLGVPVCCPWRSCPIGGGS